jgi:membrane protein implicated in regulation of membrane protease activity
VTTLAYVWLVAALALIAGEVLTGTVFLAAVAVGCFAAAGTATLGLPIEVQLSALAGGALLSFFLARPVLDRFGYGGSSSVRTNIDKLPGLPGRVVEPIAGPAGYGRVVVNGDDWRAQSATGEAIPAGCQVLVVEVHGATLVVIPENALRR